MEGHIPISRAAPSGYSTPNIDAALIAGVDEAGRGPLAGPVVAAAVILCDGGIAGLDALASQKDWRKRQDHRCSRI